MIFFEPQCIGFAHSEINAAYILLYSKAFPTEKIIFYGETEHLKIVEQELSAYAVSVIYKSIEAPRSTQSYVRRLFIELGNILKVFLMAKKLKSNVLLLSITSATLLGVKICGLGIRQNIYIVVHGVLETVKQMPKGILSRLFWFKYYFVFFNSLNVKYILNGKYIENNVLNLFPLLIHNVASLDIPYFFNESFDGNKETSGRVTFSSAGVASTSKGSHYFFKLAKDVIQEHKLKNVEFCYIGHFVDHNMDQYVNDHVELPSKCKPLSKASYQEHFMDTDYLVFFYPKDSYKFGVSGVFFDAVKFERPIIAIKNDFFDYYFGKYGQLGWLCNDYEDVLKLVMELSTDPKTEECARITENYKKIKSAMSLNNQVSTLKELLV